MRGAAALGRTAGSVRQITTKTNAPTGRFTENNHCPNDVRDDPADRRTDERAEPEHRSDQALVLAALGRREQVADDRERDREERSRAEALERAEQHEMPHLRRQA